MRFLVLALLFVLGASAPALSKAPPQANWLTTIASTPEGGVRMGNPAAPVKLVEYGSRSCPVCGRFAAESGTLRSQYVASGKVSYEFREFLIHPQDIGGAVIGKCVSDRNFFIVLDAMYANQAALNHRADTIKVSRYDQIAAMEPLAAARAWSDDTGYTELVRQIGMPEARIAACFSNPQAIPQLARRLKAATDAGVNGTPAFFINGKRAQAILWSQLEPLLKAAGG